MTFYVNARCKKILSILTEQSGYIPLGRLASITGVSRRTIYYDLDKINLWLRQAGIPELEMVREKGVFISYGSRGKIQSLIQQSTKQQVYVFSPVERSKCIICYLICAQMPIYLEQLTECFEVSRNTIFADLKEVSVLLKNYELSLDYHPKTGYKITGDTVRTRALFGMYFNELSALFTSNTLPFFQIEKIEPYLHQLEDIQRELEINYVEGVLLSIAAMIPLCYRHETPIVFTGLKQDQIKKSKEFHLVTQYFSDLPGDEQIYLTLHLLGSRVNLVPEEYFESDLGSDVYDMTKTIISEFEKIACIRFDNREMLERALFVHLNTSLYRYYFGIQIGNELADDVIREYPELFAITKEAAKRLEMEFGVLIPEGEIAYLAMHFGGFLKVSGPDTNHLRILIVCVNGISTGNLLKREVQKLLPFAEIVDVVAAAKLINPQLICDLIISTINVNSIVPTIVVHPILTEMDRMSILNHRLVAPKNVAVQRDGLFQLVKKYVAPEHYQNLLHDLTAYIQNGLVSPQKAEIGEYDLLSMLDLSRIKVIHQSCVWKQSIRMAGQYLVERESITTQYLDTIIDQLQFYGPYMFLNDDTVLAHAKPEDGVNCLDVSMAIFHEPVVFPGQRKAKLVLVLAAEDQEKHLHILQDILSLLEPADAVETLTQSLNPAEALQVVRCILAKNKQDTQSK